MQIETRHIYPPIPIRCCDWVAFYPDLEDSSPQGYGETEQEAIQDLLDKDCE